MNVLHHHASTADMNFIRDIIMTENCPEYNGYNTRVLRNNNTPNRTKTCVIFQPLIDMNPIEPDTILSAMVLAQELSNKAGQNFAVLTCDQQLYKIAVQVQWNEPGRFRNLTIRLGGMHMTMSFIGCIGFLMKGTGLEETMSCVFGGVKKMLEGKNIHRTSVHYK